MNEFGPLAVAGEKSGVLAATESKGCTARVTLIWGRLHASGANAAAHLVLADG